jgi:DNA-binding transcriptional LysR family regulator
MLALPEEHPLAKQSGIGRQDLTNEPIIWIAKTLNLALHQYLLESFRRSGCAPQIVHEVNTVSELLDLAGTGTGLGFVKRSIAERVRVPGVIFRESSSSSCANGRR